MLHKVLMAVSAGLVLLVQPVSASDLDMLNAPEVDISQSSVGQGWYIRGDLGYAAAMNGDEPSFRTIDTVGGYSSGRFDTARFSKPVSFDAGIGYQFNDYLRADLTTDYFTGSLSGSSSSASRCAAGQPVATSCRFSQDADYTAIGAMANGYVDLGTFVGFTPYLGAGLGVTRISWDALGSQGACVSGTAACNGTTYQPTSLEGADSYRFSYALMAGVAYDLTDRVKFDLGYRYSDIAGGDMFRFGSAETALGATGVKGMDDGFTRHEVRAGIRISLW